MTIEDLVKEYLSSEGYRYEIDKDGDIHFRYEGLSLYHTVDEKDQGYFRIIMPGIYQIDGDRTKVLEAINVVSRDLKVVKAFLIEDYLWLAVEMFLDDTPELADFFPRCLSVLQAARRKALEVIEG